jgi:tRNA threonylcarbamoyladenosine biosynthesis protein TsaE
MLELWTPGMQWVKKVIVRVRMLIETAADMRALGARLGGLAQPGDVIGLVGELGAGKTVLVQGLAAGLGVPPDVPVTSPTFTLVHLIEDGRLPLAHIDLYRLDAAAELDHIGVDEIYRSDAVVAVEWIDRFPEAMPRERLMIRIMVADADGRRQVELEPHGERAAALAAALAR